MQKIVRLIHLRLIAVALAAMALLTIGCARHEGHTKGVYVLVDASTANADGLRFARDAINTLLGNLTSQDTLAVARIDSIGFGKKHIPTTVTFAQRPSVMIAQKRVIQKQISAIQPSPDGNRQVDLTGGILQAVQFLSQIQSTQKIVLILSGLSDAGSEEELKEMFFRLEGIEVIAPDLTGPADTMPEAQRYRQRMNHLKTLIESGGGSLRFINDFAQFDL